MGVRVKVVVQQQLQKLEASLSRVGKTEDGVADDAGAAEEDGPDAGSRLRIRVNLKYREKNRAIIDVGLREDTGEIVVTMCLQEARSAPAVPDTVSRLIAKAMRIRYVTISTFHLHSRAPFVGHCHYQKAREKSRMTFRIFVLAARHICDWIN